MRLIDADALIRAHIVDNANDDAEVISRYDVNCAPTVDAVNVVWHKVTTRPLTDEEVAYYAEMEMDGIEYIFDCEMPDDGQEILIATKWGTDKDICSNDAEYGIGLEGSGDWDGVYAWAEMPKYEVSE